MEPKELRKKSDQELEELLKSSQKKLTDLKINYSLGKLKNAQEIKLLKKDIARVLTILNERKQRK
ncbi:MAG: 50S ribosomal protein L29 [Minisyncoccia bacterium]